MKKYTPKNAPLIHAAMLTTLLVMPLTAQAVTVISTTVSSPQDSNVAPFGPITITSDGQVQIYTFGGGTAPDLVTLDNPTPADNTLTIAPNNVNGVQAIDNENRSSTVNSVVKFTETGNLTIGDGSGIYGFADFPGDHTIYVSNGTATVQNAGTIEAFNGSNANLNITVDTGATLILQNQSTGVITGSLPVNIAAGSVNSAISNAGTIQNNSGNQTASAIQILGNLSSFSNTGTISSTDPSNGSTDATILVTGTTIAGGLNNSGNISSLIHQNGAIDLSTSINVALNQMGGTITGNVLLAPGNNITALNMTGGQIVGNVTSVPGTSSNILALHGGSISGTVSIVNADSFNFYGGSFTLLDGDINSTFNLFTSFTYNGSNIGTMGNFVVHKGGVFNTAQPLANIDGAVGLQINSGGTFIANSPVTGTTTALTNAGTLVLNDTITFNNAVFDNTGNVQIGPFTSATVDNYHGMPGSTITPIIYPNSFQTPATAAITVGNGGAGAATLASGSMIAPQLLPDVYYERNSQYYMVNGVGGGTVVDDATVVQPNTVMLRFAQSQPASNELLLTLVHNSFQQILPHDVTNDGPTSIAANLDGLDAGSGPTDPALRTMLAGLESATSVALLNDEVESLLPADNWGMPQAVTYVMNSNFSTIRSQMKKIQALYSAQAETIGQSSGDICENGALWGKMLGAYLDQSTREGISGYHAKAFGFVIGGEREVTDCAAIGLAAGYTKVNVEGKGFAPKNQHIKDIQGTLYGWYTPTDQLFVDAQLGVAGQQYDTNRLINTQTIINIAQGSFKGWQVGAQGNVGYAVMNNDCFFAAPIAGLRYNYLSINGYNETGAGSLGLNVASESFNEFAGGIGIQLAMLGKTYNNVTYVPELDVMFLYDFHVDAQNTTSNFLGGGVTFATNGVKPGRSIIDLDFVWNVQFAPDSIVTIEYDVEFRSQFIGNAGYVQYYYYW